MAFYKSISRYYDDIFPLNPIQLNFVLKSFESTSGLKVLDVGCGTGSLSIALAPHLGEVVGIDPDQKMLDLAIEKSGDGHHNLSFYPYGMLDLEKHEIFNNLDSVLCFGNTLVHLGSEEEILEFLRQAKSTLKSGGKLLIQIINYERIFKENIASLSSIENEHIKFVRNYHYPASMDSLDFETILTIKKSDEVIRNSVKLFPIQKKKLQELLLQAGYGNIHYFGNFKRGSFDNKSIPLIVEANS